MLEADKDLLPLFRRGERRALAKVYRLYVDDVARTLRAGVWIHTEGATQRLRTRLTEPELEELIHETFSRAFTPTAREKYDGVRPYGAYLAAIARNLLIDKARAAANDRQTVSIEPGRLEAVAEPEPPDPLWPIEERELGALVSSVVERLPERERAVFELRYRDGLRHIDVADHLGLSRITVRRIDVSVRYRILKELRRAGYASGVDVWIPAPRRGRSEG